MELSSSKTLLRLAMARIKLLRNKRDVLVKQMRKDIAQLLSSGQDPSARIRVEHIAREQNVMAAYDMIELFCELIIVRLPIIESTKGCPMDLKEAICTLIFASPRCSDLPELLQIRSVFSSKYGKEFVAAALELRPDCGVNRRVIEKLSVRAPSGETKLKLLMEIAAEHHVNWDHEATLAELLKKPEDLLDGPKKFFGASEAPIPDPEPPAPKPEVVQAPVPEPQRATAPPPARPLLSAMRRPAQKSTPPPPQKVESPSKVGRYNSPNFDSSPPHSRQGPDHNTRSRARESPTHTNASYDNVAAAAQAAAQSADRAVAAARIAARLAETHPFKREQSPPPPPSRTVSHQGSRRPQQSSSSEDDDDDDDGWSNIRSETEPMTRQQRQRLRQQQKQQRQLQQEQEEQGRNGGSVYVTSDSYYRNGSNSVHR